jgi:hypothetical protein
VLLTMPAAGGGLRVSLSSSASTLSVPASVTVPATTASAQFTAVVSSSAVSQTVTVTAAAAGGSVITTINTLPTPVYYLHGNTHEIIGTANGSQVNPTITPSGFSGTLSVRGSGYVTFDPVQGSDGLCFYAGGQQSTNTSFISFLGRQLGSVFNRAGQVSFTVQSAYSFAERSALPTPNDRYAFDVYDKNSEQFHFRVYTSGGRLIFAYSTDGSPVSTYTVQTGQEDVIFGKGVVATIRIVWTNTSNRLYVNEQVVNTVTYSGSNPNWNVQSSLTIGAQGTRGGATGAFSFDDAIAEFQVH